MSNHNTYKISLRRFFAPLGRTSAVLVVVVVSAGLLARRWQVMIKHQCLSDALVMAAKAGDYSRVKTLLQHGADPDSRVIVKQSFLEQIDDWIDVHIRPPEQLDNWLIDCPTALTAAATNGHGGVVRLLLSYGADPNLLSANPDEEGPDYRRLTALEWAKLSNQLEIVPILQPESRTWDAIVWRKEVFR